MARYYALVAGLPNLTAEMQKLPITTAEFYDELLQVLTSRDKDRLNVLLQEDLNRDILNRLLSGELTEAIASEDEDTAFGPGDSYEDGEGDEDKYAPLRTAIEAARSGKRLPRLAKDKFPSYIYRFVYDLYFRPAKSEDEEDAADAKGQEVTLDPLALEDKLAQYYYDWAEYSSMGFLREWFRLNKNIRNILAVYTCRRLGWDASKYIVGDGYIEQQLLTSTAKDFGLSDELPYLGEVLRIAEEKDIARRERLIDLVKWNWMDEWTFVRVFDLDNVLCYFLRLQILERWTKLDEKTGEETFRKIVYDLKGSSAQVLQDFKRQQHR